MPSTTSKRRAKNKTELRALFKASKTMHAKVDRIVIDHFIREIKFVDGRAAHMHYGPLQKQLGNAEFSKVLAWIGISNAKFRAYKDMVCNDDGSGNLSCIGDPGQYCDPTTCPV